MYSRYRLLALLCIALAAGCNGAATPDPADTLAQTAPVTKDAHTCIAAADIVLRGQLHGALDGDIIGRLSNTECRGMPRPASQGLRLHFRTTGIERGTPVVVILGIDNIARGESGDALRTTVTMIDEDAEQFFSTSQQENCFSDVQRHSPSTAQQTSIEGVLWCTAAIPQINGPDSVRITDLYFSGTVTWPGDS